MMMILGMFVFSLPTLAYQELQRQTEWKHPGSPRVGTNDAHQFTGKGEDTITLSGWIAPELTGSLYSLDALRLMADTGKAWILIQGNGRIYGQFVITSMTEGRKNLSGTGNPGRVDFSMTLKRVDESVMGLLNKLGDPGSIRSMLNIDALSKDISGAIDSGKSAFDKIVGGVKGAF